jgi:hypothetical protein
MPRKRHGPAQMADAEQMLDVEQDAGGHDGSRLTHHQQVADAACASVPTAAQRCGMSLSV